MLSEQPTLAATRLFDPERKYQTRSIPGTLNLLECHAALWRVPKWEPLKEALVKGSADASYLEQLSDEQLTHAVVKHFRTTLPDADAVRQIRDKVIAHNERIERSALTSPTWKEALSLINYAKDFLITIGDGYLNILFGNDSSSYILTDEAKSPAVHLRRLLRAAGIGEGRQP